MIVHTKGIKKMKDGLRRRAASLHNLSYCKDTTWWLWQLFHALPRAPCSQQHCTFSLPDFLRKRLPTSVPSHQGSHLLTN